MSAGSFTPGPWFLKPDANDGGAIHAPRVVNSSYSSVASVHARDTLEEFDANVALIVAAPEMLAELERVRDHLTTVLDAPNLIAHTRRLMRRRLDEIEALIVKARGL